MDLNVYWPNYDFGVLNEVNDIEKLITVGGALLALGLITFFVLTKGNNGRNGC